MFIVNNIQIRKLAEFERKKFITFLLNEVNVRFGNQDISKEELQNQLNIFVDEAVQHDFEFEDDIEQYVYLKYLYPAFKVNPFPTEVYDILLYPDRSPDIKINELICFFEENRNGEQ